MSIRPLDMQVMIPKSSELSRQTHQQNNKYAGEQFHMASEHQRKVEQNKRKVIEQDDTSQVLLHKDQKNKHQKEQQKQKKRQANQGAATLNKASGYRHGHFDIKI